jgi:hypothetical protein
VLSHIHSYLCSAKRWLDKTWGLWTAITLIGLLLIWARCCKTYNPSLCVNTPIAAPFKKMVDKKGSPVSHNGCKMHTACQTLGASKTGLPDFSCFIIPEWENTYQNGTTHIRWPQNIPKGYKIHQVTINYPNIFHSKALQNTYTHIGIFGMNIYLPSGNPALLHDQKGGWGEVIIGKDDNFTTL